MACNVRQPIGLRHPVWQSPQSISFRRYTAYCIWSMISSVSNLNRWSRSLGLCCHVSLKRDEWNWDWRFWFDDTPEAIGCFPQLSCVPLFILSSIPLCPFPSKKKQHMFPHLCFKKSMWGHVVWCIFLCLNFLLLHNWSQSRVVPLLTQMWPKFDFPMLGARRVHRSKKNNYVGWVKGRRAKTNERVEWVSKGATHDWLSSDWDTLNRVCRSFVYKTGTNLLSIIGVRPWIQKQIEDITWMIDRVSHLFSSQYPWSPKSTLQYTVCCVCCSVTSLPISLPFVPL